MVGVGGGGARVGDGAAGSGGRMRQQGSEGERGEIFNDD